MEESGKMESHLSSAAAFVEGGIQDSCDDACSICLEAFCESDPSTVTSCKHEFHLQCILEWCQRSAQCPMCWQPISLKDPTSQELLEAVERERSIRSNQTRNTTIFHHIGDFELPHLAGANEAELEERIYQHLAAAAAMGRAHHISRREGQPGRSTAQGRPQFIVFSPNAASIGAASGNSAQREGNEPTPAIGASMGEEAQHITAAQTDQVSVLPSGGSVPTSNRPILFNNGISAGQSSPISQDRAGPSDFQSFSESLKSRLNAVSMRYKESITKNTRGWKERLFSRNTSVADLGSEVRREVNAGIATVSRMMERLDTRENRRTSGASTPLNNETYSASEPSNESVTENHTDSHLDDNNPSASCAATSGPN